MYGRILGFQRLARCPKWTPASIRSFTWTMATQCPPAPGREVGDGNGVRERSPRRSWRCLPFDEGEEGHRSTGRPSGKEVARQNARMPAFNWKAPGVTMAVAP